MTGLVLAGGYVDHPPGAGCLFAGAAAASLKRCFPSFRDDDMSAAAGPVKYVEMAIFVKQSGRLGPRYPQIAGERMVLPPALENE